MLWCPGLAGQTRLWCPGFAGQTHEGNIVAAQNKMPGTAVIGGAGDRRTQPVSVEGDLDVSELLADRPAAPSPFGDDQTFPLPVDQLIYIPSTPA
jgi:hypothetical protein